jgi:hypothetical protein
VDPDPQYWYLGISRKLINLRENMLIRTLPYVQAKSRGGRGGSLRKRRGSALQPDNASKHRGDEEEDSDTLGEEKEEEGGGSRLDRSGLSVTPHSRSHSRSSRYPFYC